MGKNEFIKFTSIKDNRVVRTKVDRESFLELMTNIKNNFVNNNQISSRFVELIPDIEEVEINELRNKDCDTPFIIIRMTDGWRETLHIQRWHKIIWGILDEYTKG